MGGGARYPYPKYVWSPAGGWWTRPSNWRSNTAIAFGGIFAITYAVWVVSADREWRYIEPFRPVPTMTGTKQYRDAEKDKQPSG